MQELNLSRNQIGFLPNFENLPALQKLILSHNMIDGSFVGTLSKNRRLKVLDVSNNNFSWKPSDFQKQLNVLKVFLVENICLWPNPFARYFKEYQFIAVMELETLVMLDGFKVDQVLRNDLKKKDEELNMRSGGVFDFTIFDVRVAERAKHEQLPESGHEQMIEPSFVPCIDELTHELQSALDNPDTLIANINEFERKVSYVWGAHICSKKRLMESRKAGESVKKLQKDTGTQACFTLFLCLSSSSEFFLCFVLLDCDGMSLCMCASL